MEQTAPAWIAGSAPFVMWGAILVFNIAVLRLLQVTLAGVDLSEALKEKAPTDTIVEVTKTIEPPPAGNAGQGKLEEREETKKVPQGAGAETSYSRVAGMVGAIVLACFIWAVGNVVLYKSFAAPAEVAGMLASLGGFFLAGAALFAPYAVNQLSSVFRA